MPRISKVSLKPPSRGGDSKAPKEAAKGRFSHSGGVRHIPKAYGAGSHRQQRSTAREDDLTKKKSLSKRVLGGCSLAKSKSAIEVMKERVRRRSITSGSHISKWIPPSR